MAAPRTDDAPNEEPIYDEYLELALSGAAPDPDEFLERRGVASEELRAQNEMLASWVHGASDQLRQLADRLRDRPAAELAEDLASFARQRPAMFLGGAFLLGLGVARLLRSSPDQAWQRSGGARGAY